MKTGAARVLKQVLISRGTICWALALLVGSVAVAHARGGGGGGGRSGGGGYARSGAASTGSFSGGATAAARVDDNRRDVVDRGRLDHPVAAGAAAGRAVDNRRDYYGGGGGAYYAELPCSGSETYIDGVTYYACGTTYYVQSYSGGSVVYVLSPPPPGY